MPNWDDPNGPLWDSQEPFWDVQQPTPTRRKSMSTAPVDDVLGYAQQAREMLNTYKVEMTAKGYDPTILMATLATKTGTLTTKNQEQEAMKTSLRTLTTEVDGIKDEAERAASSACDTILAAFGRGSEQGTEATRLRSSIAPRARASSGGTTPPAPPSA